MSLASLSSDTLVADPQYARLKEHVVEATGLSYYTDKDPELVRRLSRRFLTLGVNDCATYLGLLRDPLRGPSELDELIAEITIGETYFFRHREHFDALRDVALPDVIARKRASRSLRIWCAGCADGPEPYSLAILLNREMAHELRAWEVTIQGTDINRHCLARAREGKFEEWALRSTPEDLKQACFLKEGRFWRIAPKYKEWVSFQYHNLVEHSFPSLLNNLSAFDLIVCRNVMIYFGPDLMKRLIRQFYNCLLPGGWLLVGPSEPNMTCFTSFRTVNATGATLYQKLDELAPNPAAGVFTMPAPSPLPSANSPVAEQPPSKCADPTLEDVRRHADCGAWDQAIQCCEQLLIKNNLDSAVHFYHGLVLEHLGRHAEAEGSLRRTIYLDRQSVLAHYYLGLLLQSRDAPRHAERSFENALNLLLTRRDAETFADADGITVAELRKLAKSHLDILRERV